VRDAGVCTAPAHDSPACNALSRANARHPANCVDAVQAQDFCAWVDKRLPTEAEWDAAARDPDPERRWDGRRCRSQADRQTCKITHQRNEDRSHLGVLDMSGNVSEWTSTSFVPDEGALRTKRVVLTVKGGSYLDTGHRARPTARSARAPRARYPDLGFRCVRGGAATGVVWASLRREPAVPHVFEPELLERYTGVWARLLARTNGVGIGEIERSTKIVRRTLERWHNGTSMEVVYELTVGWATVQVRDAFLVRLDPLHGSTAEDLPLDRWLEPSDVERLATDPRSHTDISRLPLGKRLHFATRDAAIAALGGGARASFSPEAMRVEVARPQWPDPDLYLSAGGVIDEAKNQCLDVTLNLVTGKAERAPMPCAMH
jgi:hypothetical protein